MQIGFAPASLTAARDQFTHLLRPGIADGVGDRDEIDAGLEAFIDQPQHLVRIDRAGDRAAQRHRDRSIHQRLVGAGVAHLAEALHVGDRGLARAMGVGLAVLFGGRDHRGDLADAGLQRLVDAAFVERKRNAVRAGQARHRRDRPRGRRRIAERSLPAGTSRPRNAARRRHIRRAPSAAWPQSTEISSRAAARRAGRPRAG